MAVVSRPRVTCIVRMLPYQVVKTRAQVAQTKMREEAREAKEVIPTKQARTGSDIKYERRSGEHQ